MLKVLVVSNAYETFTKITSLKAVVEILPIPKLYQLINSMTINSKFQIMMLTAINSFIHTVKNLKFSDRIFVGGGSNLVLV